MKRLMMIGLFIAATALVHGQSADTSRVRYRGGEQAASSGRAPRVDRFIDKDGDGICDDRASGLGFRRGGQGMKMHAGRAVGIQGQGYGKKLQKGRK